MKFVSFVTLGEGLPLVLHYEATRALLRTASRLVGQVPSLTVVHAAFERKTGWHVVFFDSTSKRRLGRELLLEEDDKLFELAKRAQALVELADKQPSRQQYAEDAVGCSSS